MIMSLNNQAAIEEYESIQRVSLSNLFTPVEKCDRLQETYPNLPNIYIKRDDFIGSLVWGNKLRKLEYSLAEALDQKADTIITCGSVYSNHARTTGQVARRLGLHCILVQNGKEPEKKMGNPRINELMNIPIHYVDSSEEREPKMKEIAEALKAEGRNPYCIPLGASDEIGSWGFVRAIEELQKQQREMNIRFDAIIHACSSGGTTAGMEVGKRLFGLEDLEIYGISADDPSDEVKQSILDAANLMMERLVMNKTITAEELNIDDQYVGEGYGIPTELSAEVFDEFIEIEGITLDPVYTAKAASALVDYGRKDIFDSSDNVLFWHTGGLLNLFK